MGNGSKSGSPLGRPATTEAGAAAASERSTPEWAEGSPALLAAIVTASDDAIVSKSLDGTILSWNRAAERLFGYPASEAVGQSINLIIPDHLRGEERSILRRLRRGERIDHFETRRVAKDGHVVEVSLTVSPVRDRDGRIVGASKVARDITEKKRIEAALQASEVALREADRRKDEFLATLSHELRNPLAPITNSLDLLRLSDDDPDLRRKAREAIGRQVSHLVRLVNDLLDVSRISRDRLELRRSRLDLAVIVREAADAWRPIAATNDQSIRLSLPARKIELSADPVRLTQVLNNLFDNACKFSPAGGVIHVTVEQPAGGRVRVSVRDEGAGIPAGELDTIFDMFAQAHQASGEMTGGLGIGLTLTRRLVELHGGTISARSEGHGQGSEFIMELPLGGKGQAGEEGRETRPRACAGRPMRILVVDDNVDNAESLSMLLKVNGHRTSVAYDGPAAIRAAGDFLPDAVLLDLGLPELDGIEVCRRIRREPWGREMRIIAVTGWGQEEDRRRSTEAGFDDHLVKPIEYGALEQVLARAPDQESAR